MPDANVRKGTTTASGFILLHAAGGAGGEAAELEAVWRSVIRGSPLVDTGWIGGRRSVPAVGK